MGKIDANGKQSRGNDALTTITRLYLRLAFILGEAAWLTLRFRARMQPAPRT
jgi:hypothetical protein